MKNSAVSKKLITLSLASALVLSLGAPFIASAKNDEGQHGKSNSHHVKIAVNKPNNNKKHSEDENEGKGHHANNNNKSNDHILNLMHNGAGHSGKIPPGLLHAFGIQKKLHRVSTSTAPLAIAQISVSQIGTSSATLSWNTNKGAQSAIFIGTASPVSTTSAVWTDGTLLTSHGATLTGLLPNTTYHYVIKGTDASSTILLSSERTFTTLSVASPDVTAPVISSVSAQNLTTTNATLTWNTNELARSEIFVSSTTPVPTSSAQWSDTTLTMSHSATFTALTPNTTYHFVIKGVDASGNVSLSPEGTFTTLAIPDTTAPILSGISTNVTGSTSVGVIWTTDELATSKVWYSTTSPVNTGTALSLSSGTLVTSHALSLSGLSASTTYYAMIESRDTANNAATSSQFSFVTTP